MKEAEIRPEHLLRRYLELSAEDATHCFGDAQRTDIACVACGGTDIRPEFAKHGFAYASCGTCGTLLQSPRPVIAAFEQFYRDSVSSRFWAEEFFPAVAEARRESIFRPRVERLAALCAGGLRRRERPCQRFCERMTIIRRAPCHVKLNQTRPGFSNAALAKPGAAPALRSAGRSATIRRRSKCATAEILCQLQPTTDGRSN